MLQKKKRKKTKKTKKTTKEKIMSSKDKGD